MELETKMPISKVKNVSGSELILTEKVRKLGKLLLNTVKLSLLRRYRYFAVTVTLPLRFPKVIGRYRSVTVCNGNDQ